MSYLGEILPVADGGTGVTDSRVGILYNNGYVGDVVSYPAKTWGSLLNHGGLTITDPVGNIYLTGEDILLGAGWVASGGPGTNKNTLVLSASTGITTSTSCLKSPAHVQTMGAAMASNGSYTLPAPINGGVMHFNCYYNGSGTGATLNSASGSQIKVTSSGTGFPAATASYVVPTYYGRTFASDGSFWYCCT
jgi:hypothetical protein